MHVEYSTVMESDGYHPFDLGVLLLCWYGTLAMMQQLSWGCLPIRWAWSSSSMCSMCFPLAVQYSAALDELATVQYRSCWDQWSLGLYFRSQSIEEMTTVVHSAGWSIQYSTLDECIEEAVVRFRVLSIQYSTGVVSRWR